MLRNLFCIFVAVVWTALMFPLVSIAIILTLNPSASMWLVKVPWSRVLIWAGGATLEVRGKENVPAGVPLIFVANHQSTIDIPVLFASVPADFRFVAKKALMYVPALGWYMWLARFVFVDRGNHREAIASLERAARQIQGGVSIAMFPEGTRSESCRVMPFKKGPFALAMRAGVPLVPVTIEGTGRLMPKNSWNITPGPIRVAIGAPIDPRPFGDDREGLMRAVREVIIEQSVQLGGLGGDGRTSVASQGKPQVEVGP
jgi:1-acyl-sn-glycerol-3-phosphate acyltransferase